MRVVIGSDHAGFPLKKALSKHIRRLGHTLVDVGAFGTDPVDYPDYAEVLARTLLDLHADRGVLICGSGVGASVAVNKVPGIRAGLCHDTYSAHQGVEHDDMNVLVLGGRVVGPELAHELVTAYLKASFTSEERHRRRLQKIRLVEARYSADPQEAEARLRHQYFAAPNRYEAFLFDMDGVITDTATIHAACWKKTFDEYLQKRSARTAEPFREFEIATDYKDYVDGKPRYHGVRDFLKSRGIVLPDGTPQDSPDAETVCGVGNRKNELVNATLDSQGVEAYAGSIVFIKALRRMGVKTALVTSSQNCRSVLRAAKVEDLFDARVDGDVIAQQHLAGKPAPDSFLKAAQMLSVEPERAVVIEDALSGVRAGANGKFGLVIGVARKGNTEELKAHGAHIVVHDLAELVNWSPVQAVKPAA